jgi:uncharacterized protein
LILVFDLDFDFRLILTLILGQILIFKSDVNRTEQGVRSTSMTANQNSPTGTTFAVKVHPRAKKNAITGKVGDSLKLSLTAPPADGKANAACIDFFAKLLNLPRSSVTIAAGHASRNKVIRVSGLSAEELQLRLQI